MRSSLSDPASPSTLNSQEVAVSLMLAERARPRWPHQPKSAFVPRSVSASGLRLQSRPPRSDPACSPTRTRACCPPMMTGRCLCGAVAFSAEHVETEHHACHCGMCRRWSGGAGFLGAASAGLTFSGTEQLVRFASSAWAERGFCNACGTVLFYFLKPTQAYMMSVGTFDDSSPFRLTREIR